MKTVGDPLGTLNAGTPGVGAPGFVTTTLLGGGVNASGQTIAAAIAPTVAIVTSSPIPTATSPAFDVKNHPFDFLCNFIVTQN